MPARPRIPDPQEGQLQLFAYELRELGEGKVSIGWIAGHEQTTVSKAALYAALSGTRVPTERTLSTLLRWWAGNPADEADDIDETYIEPVWAWIERLPRDHEGRRLATAWRARLRSLARRIELERERVPKAERVVIAVPREQQRFIAELTRLIKLTGLEDELWLMLGSFSSRVERYLAGEAIPTDSTCWLLVERLIDFLPQEVDPMDALLRLRRSAEVARTGRARERRVARRSRRASR
ncbi:hypothetical protein ABZ923_36795 [Streptomyces sp. NPDC046881]|uniref:hypothetical protein n=1 Tax=Streptomyces sp. NPDC046881 TaxID=3155374 RepID=UPI003409AF90